MKLSGNKYSEDQNLMGNVRHMINEYTNIFQGNVNMPVVEVVIIVATTMMKEQGATVEDIEDFYGHLMDLNDMSEAANGKH